MVGEIIAFLALGLLDRTGLFELKPPSLLKQKKEFPDCVSLLDGENVGRFFGTSARRYVRLCRLTGLAWSVWVGVAIAFCWAIVDISYHWLRFRSGDMDILDVMDRHSLLQYAALAPPAGQITCFSVWCAVAAAAVLLTVYYTILLGFCRESEANLRTAGQRKYRAAGAS